jgi:hypothetical protein
MSTERTVKEQAVNLVHTISEMGNLFRCDTTELLMLDTRVVIDESVVNTVRTVDALGKDQYNTYRKSVINDRTRIIHDPMKRNSLPLFRCPTRKTKNKQSGQIAMVKDDVALFSRFYIVMQHRGGHRRLLPA